MRRASVTALFLTLLNPDRITAADRAAPRYGSIHTDVAFVVLGCGAQDARIVREIPLRESSHHATPALAGNVQPHRRPDCERVTDPGIFRKALLARGQLHDDVWTKAPDLEAALRIQLAQAIERCRGYEMNHGAVEESPLGQS